MKKILVLMFLGLIVFGCESDQAKTTLEKKSTSSVSETVAEDGISAKDDSLRNTDIVEIIYSTDVHDSTLNKKVVGVYKIKSNGTDKRLLGKVKLLQHGPVYLPSKNSFVFTGEPLNYEGGGYKTWFYEVNKDSALLLIDDPEITAHRIEKSKDDKYLYFTYFSDVFRYSFKDGKLDSIYGGQSSFKGERIGNDGIGFITTERNSAVVYNNMKTGERDTIIPGDKKWSRYFFSGDLKRFYSIASISVSPDSSLISCGELRAKPTWKEFKLILPPSNLGVGTQLDFNGKYIYTFNGYMNRVNTYNGKITKLFKNDSFIDKFSIIE